MTNPIPDEILQRARDRADWLVDAIATCLQDRRFLRGDPEEDKALTESVFLNGQKAIAVALMRHETRALMAERNAALEEAASILDRRAKEENERCDRLRHTRQYKAREAAHVARIAQSDATAIRNMKVKADE